MTHGLLTAVRFDWTSWPPDPLQPATLRQDRAGPPDASSERRTTFPLGSGTSRAAIVISPTVVGTKAAVRAAEIVKRAVVLSFILVVASSRA
jgi:hypothetical protein